MVVGRESSLRALVVAKTDERHPDIIRPDDPSSQNVTNLHLLRLSPNR